MHLVVVISRFLSNMILPAGTGALVCLLLTPLRHRRLTEHGLWEQPCRTLWLTLFAAFAAGLFGLIVLPSGLPTGGLHYNLIPFLIFRDIAHELRAGNVVGFTISFLGNIVMFAPLGFFPALLWRQCTWKRALGIGFLSSLTIELCQLPLGRSSDVDDLWLNSLGALLGFGLYLWLERWKPVWAKDCKVKVQIEEEDPSWT